MPPADLSGRGHKRTSRTRQKFDFRMEPKITTLHPACFLIIAMYSVCCCSLPVSRRSSLKKGTLVTYFSPALDPPLDRSCQKTTTLVRDHKHFIPSKFRKYPSISSAGKADYVFQYIYMHKCNPPPPFNHINTYIKNSLKFFKQINLLYKHSPTYKHGKYT